MSYRNYTIKELAQVMLGSAYQIEMCCKEIRERRECEKCVFNDEKEGCLMEKLINDYDMFDRFDKLKG